MPQNTSTKKDKQLYTATLTGKSWHIKLSQLEMEELLLLLQALEPYVLRMEQYQAIDIRPQPTESLYGTAKTGSKDSLLSSMKAHTTIFGPLDSQNEA